MEATHVCVCIELLVVGGGGGLHTIRDYLSSPRVKHVI